MAQRMRTLIGMAGAIVLGTGAPALACTDTDSVLAHFDTVREAYIAAAPGMTPEQFGTWSAALDRFGVAMSELDFPAACQAIDEASLELGFDAPPAATSNVARAPDINVPATPAPQPTASGARVCPRARCATWRLRF